MREGSLSEARTELARATELDPTFAAAHVRWLVVANEVDTVLRSHLQLAQQFRQSLDAHDAELLWTFVPIASTPADMAESERRLEKAAERFPDSAEIEIALGGARQALGDLPGALAANAEALRRDPGFVAARAAEAYIRMGQGDSVGAKESLRRCLDDSPTSTMCLELLNAYALTEGRCVDAAEIARRRIVLQPNAPEPYDNLANALVGEGRLDDARVAVDAMVARRSGRLRRLTELQMRTNFAVLRGDFEAAAEEAHVWARETDPRPDEWGHITSARTRMAIALESGRSSDASRIADDYLHRVPAWAPSDAAWGTSIYALSTKYVAGTLDARSFRIERDAWMKRATANGQETANNGLLWLVGYAMPIQTATDGADALAALPSYLPLPSEANRGIEYDEALGKAYLRGGRHGDAVTPLRASAMACERMTFPFHGVWASAMLGEALEAGGDAPGACTAYAGVIAAWGHAKPRSVTAERALSGARRLRCNL
jgi:serine/threonine-protein kinase